MITPKLAHKSIPENVLIKPTSDPFVFLLDYDPDVKDRLCDHVTGNHIPAMILIEAGRQAATVVLETLHKDKSLTFQATLNSVSAKFLGFAFPVETILSVTRSSRVETVVSVWIGQSGRDVADLEFEIPLIRKDLLARLEQRALRQVTK